MPLCFDLVWMSGARVGRFCVGDPRSEEWRNWGLWASDDIERFLQDCEEGCIHCIPKVGVTEMGAQLEHYRLVYDGVQLPLLFIASKLSEHIIPFRRST